MYTLWGWAWGLHYDGHDKLFNEKGFLTVKLNFNAIRCILYYRVDLLLSHFNAMYFTIFNHVYILHLTDFLFAGINQLLINV